MKFIAPNLSIQAFCKVMYDFTIYLNAFIPLIRGLLVNTNFDLLQLSVKSQSP